MTRTQQSCILALAWAAMVNCLSPVIASGLSEAAGDGEIQKVRSLLEGGTPADVRDRPDDPTALAAAAQNGRTEIVRLLLKHGADPNAVAAFGRGGDTALSLAARDGCIDVVRVLLGAHARVNGEPGGDSPLALAITREHQGIALLLIRHGSDRSIRDWRGETLLMKAVESQEAQVTKALLAKGANVKVVASRGWTALSLAAHSGNHTIVKMLLNAGADPNEEYGFPLRTAAEGGHSAVVRLLIARGAKPDAHDPDRDTALAMAAYAGQTATIRTLLACGASRSSRALARALSQASLYDHPSTVIALLRAGANPNARLEEGGTPLFSAGKKDVIEALIAGGARVNALDEGGRTALFEAAEMERPEAASALLAHGADPNIRDKKGVTAMSLALLRGREEMVASLKAAGARDRLDLIAAVTFGRRENLRALLEAGADPNQRWADGRVPLIEAARAGRAEIIAELVAHGADVHARQQSRAEYARNQGPMHWAASFGHTEAMQALLDAGGDVDERDAAGWTPLMNAIRSNKPQAALWLIEHGANVAARDQQGDSAINYAAGQWEPKILRALLAKGAPGDAAGFEGATPLMNAVSSGSLESVNSLLDAGANPNARDKEGRTALMKAREPDFAQALLLRGAVLDVKDNAGQTARDHAMADHREEGLRFFDRIDRSRLLDERKLIEPGTVVYAGPDGLDGWRRADICPPQGWQFKDGALTGVSPYWIARDVPLPGLASVAFTLSWTEWLWFSVTLYKDGRSWGGDCYELIFDSGHVSLQRVAGAQKPQAQYYFKPSAEVDIPRTGAQVQILADRKARHFALVIDGRLAGEWTDPESPMALGDGIMFQPIGNAAQVRLSKIKVTAWDGKTLVER